MQETKDVKINEEDEKRSDSEVDSHGNENESLVKSLEKERVKRLTPEINFKPVENTSVTSRLKAIFDLIAFISINEEGKEKKERESVSLSTRIENIRCSDWIGHIT